MSPTPALRPLAAVLDELTGALAVLEPRRVAAGEAVGGILAEPLVAPGPLPPTAVALRAGFAVFSRDLVGASSYSPVPLLEDPVRVRAGEPLPSGADAVLPPDCVVENGFFFEALASVAPGENAVRSGDDAGQGEVLREAGAVRPSDAALALACGLASLSVRRALIGLAAPWPGLDFGLGPIPGAEIRNDPSACDILLVVSDDPDDFAPERLVAARLALRPGETAQVGLSGTRALVSCPPRLDALFAVSRCLLRPLVRHLTGERPPGPWLRGPLTRKLASTVGLSEVAVLRGDAERGFEPLAVGALPFAALGRADGWTLIPPESEGLAAGEMVAVESLSL